MGFYKNKNILNNLNKSKTLGPLILIDPVQKDRNITAVISNDNFSKFKNHAKKYLKSKSEKFFIKKDIVLSKLKDYIIIEITPIKASKNVLSGKLSRLVLYIKDHLDREGFIVQKFDWMWNKKIYLWYKVKNENLEKLKKHYGPKLNDKINIRKFKERWANYKIGKGKGRVFVYAPRRFTNVIDFVKYLSKDEFLSSFIREINVYKK